MHEKEGTLLVGTYRGLAISKDGGQEWELKTIADGMGSNRTVSYTHLTLPTICSV